MALRYSLFVTTYNASSIKGDVQNIDRLADGLIEIQLVGHEHRYQVRVDRSGAAPRLVEMRIVSPDDSADIGPITVRQIPVRRLAESAAKFEAYGDGAFTTIAEIDDPTLILRPERSPGGRGNKRDDAHYRQVALLLMTARENGASPREYVAAHAQASKPTVDKWIAEAKRRGFLRRDWATATANQDDNESAAK
ncbi:hypothetical protein LX13_004517 [Williamsia maris]|uniref:Uncharacterized protein n=1 Tax=Williamsia maris TaxID=72806 RepID=A0ABT1HL75_9NOCA|nr:hypothetical protein [Williamsia maris]